MRDLDELNQYRRTDDEVLRLYGSHGDGTCGVFQVFYSRTGAHLLVIASSAGGWDHLSVSLKNRCPNWHEMEFVKRMFFKDDEVAVQFHVKPVEHISFADTCLHIWRKQDFDMPLPPTMMV
jgi:hypothetical protein